MNESANIPNTAIEYSTKPSDAARCSYCYLIFNLNSRQNVIEAVELYRRAFHAEITSRDEMPGNKEWIGIDITLFQLGIFIQSNNEGHSGECCIHFATEEEFYRAYHVLKEEAEVLYLVYHFQFLP